MAPSLFGEVQLIFSSFALFNVLLAYGMETAFFRFFSAHKDQNSVVSTALISLGVSTGAFCVFAMLAQQQLATLLEIDPRYMKYVIFILALDALVIIPFAKLRAKGRAIRYAIIKLINVVVNLALNLWFLLILPTLDTNFWSVLYQPNYEIMYILMANMLASGVTLILMIGPYFESNYVFDLNLWKKMIRYALPIMIAGIAFTINEVFDRILLAKLLPPDIAKAEMGKYAGCYKLAIFMTLFGTAFRLGIEPFFFSHSRTVNPQKTYAKITNYFVILGSLLLLTIVVFSDPLKVLIIRDEAYWEAMSIVPIVVLASFCLGIYHNLSVWYKVTDRTFFGAYISAMGAVLTLVINYLLIPKIGYMASALATLVAYASMMIVSYLLGQQYYPIPYNMRKIGFYSGLALVFAAMSFYVFERNLWVGTAMLFLFLIILYRLEGNNLKTLFLKREA